MSSKSGPGQPGKLWATISSSSESESESDGEIQQPVAATRVPNYALSDSDSDTGRRVIKTAKEKHYDTLMESIKKIRLARKIENFEKILNEFGELEKKYSKSKASIEREEGGVPRYYVRTLVQIEDLCNTVFDDKEKRKKLTKANSKALTTLRMKIRKYNKEFEDDVAKYRENPDPEGEEEEEDSSESSTDTDVDADAEELPLPGAIKAPGKQERKQKPEKPNKFIALRPEEKEEESEGDKSESEGEGDSDSSEWPSDSESESSSDEEPAGGLTAAYFLKKPDAKEDIKAEKKAATADKRQKRREDRQKRDDEKFQEKQDEEDSWKHVNVGVAEKRERLFAKDSEINHEIVYKKLSEVLALRGRKRVDRHGQIDMLKELMDVSKSNNLGPALEVKILFGVISCLYDYNASVTNCMKPKMWNKCLAYVSLLIDTLVRNPELTMSENVPEESETFEKPPYRIHGCPLTITERLDEEFTKMLQSADAHAPEYLERLKDEIRVCHIIDQLVEYLESGNRGTPSELCRAYILKIEHLYFKFDPSVFKKKEAKQRLNASQQKSDVDKLADGFQKVEITVGEGDESKTEMTPEELEKAASLETSADVMDRLCKYIYAKDTTDRIRTQAVLAHIYHHSLHDNWFEARDLMLMSHLQQNIIKADIPLQILYNRALVQLGLCAFRQGYIREAHTALLDIQIMGRAKELLAQGLLPRQQERTPEQEKLEKRRQVPFHKHINLELLECVYLVSAMLLEIPDVAANEYSIRKKMISRIFYNQLRKYEEQPLVGLPESMREHVVAASKAMRLGNWRLCTQYIINDKMNTKVWNLFYQADRVRSMLRQKIREESLRAYLFTYSNVYDSISVQVLGDIFELETATVHSIISKMIINEELMASLDEPTQSVVMHRTEPSRIQGLSLQLADKINNLVEQNEKMWELKQGGGMAFINQGGRIGFGDHQQRPYQNRQRGQYQQRHHHNQRHNN